MGRSLSHKVNDLSCFQLDSTGAQTARQPIKVTCYTMAQLVNLPVEILHEVTDRLDLPQVLALSTTCRALRVALHDIRTKLRRECHLALGGIQWGAGGNFAWCRLLMHILTLKIPPQYVTEVCVGEELSPESHQKIRSALPWNR